MSDKFFVGLDLTGFENNGVQPPISRVTLKVDDETVLTAGDDTGTELIADCPHGTRQMVDAILAQVKGYRYQMFTADDAALDPAAELGDGVTAGGVYSVLSRIEDDGSGYAGLSAPGESELESEYPSAGPMTREFDRKIAETRSSITKTAEEIRLEVENKLGGLSASFGVRLDGITSRVEDTESGLSQTLRVAADGVTITNAQGSRLTIDGGQIDASKIKAEQLDASKIHAEDLNLTGSITWGDLAGDARSQVTSAQNAASDAQSTASSALSTAYNANAAAVNAANTVNGWTYPGSTCIDGRQLMTGTVKASTIQGGSVYLLDYSGSYAGAITLTGASSAGYAVDITSYGAMRLSAQSGDVYLESTAHDTAVWASDNVYIRGNLGAYNRGSLGTSVFKWSDVYADNSVIQTSDLTVKKDVRYGLEDYDALFDALKPMSFLFTDGESGRRHLGMGAQDVEAAMEALEVSSLDFAGFIKTARPDGSGHDYALRYGEFIPLCIEQIQRLKARVAELEGRTS